MAVWPSKEELEEMLEMVEKEMPYFEEAKQMYREMLADLPKYEADKACQLRLFHKLCPDRCGKIDFEKNTVQYNTEKYTEWFSNSSIDSIEDYVKAFNIVGLDYEIRMADLYDISKTFSVYYANTKEDKIKYRTALELQSLYSDYYKKLLEDTGIYQWNMCGYKYSLPWTGCEKEIAPDKYSDENPLICEEEVIKIMTALYPEAYAKATAPKPIESLNFEKVNTPLGVRKLCHAKMDKEHFEKLKVDGFNLLEIDIKAEKFQGEYEMKIEDGREVYYMDFFMDED